MKEINIARVLVKTQEKCAYGQLKLRGVLSSVSKWKRNRVFRITILPMLAAYFNISIDDLIDYKPQMTREDIRKLYRKLASNFTKKPFDSVLEDCRQIIKKYYSCFPLLLQMGILMINHVELLKDPQKSVSLLEEARALFKGSKRKATIALKKQALFMEDCVSCRGIRIPAMSCLSNRSTCDAA